MDARPLRVVNGPAARPEIGAVAVERLGDGQRTALVFGCAGLPTRELARRVEGLPVVQDVRRRGRFEVVGERDSLEPFAARAVSRADGPCPGTLVAPVAEVDAWRDLGIVWLLRDRELAPGACRFELGSAGLGHGERLRVSGWCPKCRSNVASGPTQRQRQIVRYRKRLVHYLSSGIKRRQGRMCRIAARGPHWPIFSADRS